MIYLRYKTNFFGTFSEQDRVSKNNAYVIAIDNDKVFYKYTNGNIDSKYVPSIESIAENVAGGYWVVSSDIEMKEYGFRM